MASVLSSTRRCDISFRVDGRIDISARCAKELGLCKGDVIDLWTEDCECLLYVKAKAENLMGRHTAMCCNTAKSGGTVRAWSVALARYILDACSEKDSVHLYVGELTHHPIIGWCFPVITRNIKR